MPNFDFIKLVTIQENFSQFDNYLNHNDSIHLKHQTNNTFLVIKQNHTVIDLFINTDRKRLEVVSFVLSKINLIIVNTLTDTEQYIVSKKVQLNQIKVKNVKKNTLIKADFLRESKIILLYICQAILIADNSILNSTNLQGLKAKSADFQFPIEQSYLIDVIKTLVINFIHSITFDSERSVNYFASEVASYFETVITLMIQLS